MCVMLILRASRQISAVSTTISLIPLWRFEFSSSRNSQTVLFDLYDRSYTMDLEDFNTTCKLLQWGNVSEPRKSELRVFLASITVGNLEM